jgi:hypothetical protein
MIASKYLCSSEFWDPPNDKVPITISLVTPACHNWDQYNNPFLSPKGNDWSLSPICSQYKQLPTYLMAFSALFSPHTMHKWTGLLGLSWPNHYSKSTCPFCKPKCPKCKIHMLNVQSWQPLSHGMCGVQAIVPISPPSWKFWLALLGLPEFLTGSLLGTMACNQHIP